MRYYEQKFPEVDEYVIVQVKQIQDMGAYVNLLEYDGIEGMILLSELSRRRIRSIQKLVRVGRNEVVVVIRVDKEKGYIDLSKRRVSAEDVVKCEERYAKGKTVHSIMRHVAEKTGQDLEKLNEAITWPLYRKYGHAHDAFKASITDADAVFEELNIEADVLAELKASIARRLTPQPVKIRADLEIRCHSYDGINSIRKALKIAEDMSTEEIPIQIKLVAPPHFVMISNATDKPAAIERLKEALQAIKKEIEKQKGEVTITKQPAATSESDDKELDELMKKIEEEKDSDEEDEDDE